MANNMKILVLEDDPERMKIFHATLGDRHEIKHAETAQECIALLKTYDADILFLDHDLGGETFVDAKNVNTGSEVVRYLTSNACRWAGPIVVHSCNVREAEVMEHNLRMAGYNRTHRIPFTALTQKYLHDPGFLV